MIGRSSGELLLEVVASAEEEVVLIAPFIKIGALERVRNAIPSSVGRVTCVTRWQPQDIASGVCDLEIVEIGVRDERWRFYMNQALHAKFFRADLRCLVGSANLTGSALGWRAPVNEELIVEVPFSFGDLSEWEAQIVGESIEITDEIQKVVLDASREIESVGGAGDDGVPDWKELGEDWIPLCSRPDLLYGVYQGRVTEDHVAKDTLSYAFRDLGAIGVIPGFAESEFNSIVTSGLTRSRAVRKIIALSETGILDHSAEEILEPFVRRNNGIEVSRAWAVVKDWIDHFLPNQYRREIGQEFFVRAKRFKRDR